MTHTKKELIEKYQALLNQKEIPFFDGINSGSRKADIQSAIECLEATDEELNDCLIVIKMALENIYKTIVESDQDWKKHYFNRFFVYSTALDITKGGVK